MRILRKLFHGDESWMCAGPGGTPMATARLENFRDGLAEAIQSAGVVATDPWRVQFQTAR